MVGASANFDAMITPVVVDGLRLRWFVPPKLGETVRWGLSWNVDSPRRWVVAEPGWVLPAEVRVSSKALMWRLPRDGTEVREPEQPAIGRAGALQFMFNADPPVPSRIDVTGALHLLAGTVRDDPNARQAWIDFDEGAATTGVVRRLRLMSLESDMLPDPKFPHGTDWGWASTQFVPGSERFYELARAPRALRSYQLTDREWGPRREDFLLVDLETAA
ncbi:hypothetical protein R3Q06_09785 [Rhodococcus erythropolis]|uniref:hypothetical protein n=1 Tax=Rhodococcus erythropolis TaxID=1833 RepID=UPI00294A1649|nr:hypothetical protein [Rhodococcus erythropolis]MDV6273792.1 hypothetical protein [Rhodococcus erythropolis]